MDIVGKLKKINGNSFKDITELLDGSNIPYRVRQKPTQTKRYFLESYLFVPTRPLQKLQQESPEFSEHISSNVRIGNISYLFAEYEVIDDISTEAEICGFSGQLVLRKGGKLTEMTAVAPE